MSVLNLPGLVQKPLGSFDGRKGALIVLLIINPFITMSPYKFSHFRIRILLIQMQKQIPFIVFHTFLFQTKLPSFFKQS